MGEAEAGISLPGSAQWMLSSLEGQMREVAGRVAEQIQTSVPAFDGLSDGGAHELILNAMHNAIRLFVDDALGREVSYAAVDDLFRKLGYRQGARGRDHEVIDQSVTIAVREISNELQVRAAENELSAGALNAINEAVTGFVAHLTEQVELGHQAGLEARNTDTGVARSRLLEGLLAGADADDLETQAAIAQWEITERVTVIAAEVRGKERIAARELGGAALTRPGQTPQLVVCASDDVADVVERLKAAYPRTRLAVCWPVPPNDVPAAGRWVNRALALVRAKVIPARPVIDCVRHRTEIWLHAEPALRRQLAQELLRPLFGETANSREILSETLLVWLETRDSAPAIAARLGVHPQTVRYRWKRINELFGDSLHDPDFVIQLTLVLKASVPLWIAGDQSDFERYQSRQAAAGESGPDA